MSVLEIYINWVNSVLAEVGSHVDGVEALQDGKVLCELIDILEPDAGLVRKVKSSGECTPLAYISTALEHMKHQGIKIRFPAEDIVQNDVKSMLDVLWMLILNYDIHFIGETVQNRSIGTGKKILLEWCQQELGTTFDPTDTLTFNLCSSNWFLKLLEQVTQEIVNKSENKTEYIDALLRAIQDRYLIKKDIIKANDIVDGTVDEHTLMIYLSLLRRRKQRLQQQSKTLSSESHRSNPAVSSTQEAPEVGLSLGASPSGSRRSSPPSSDVKHQPVGGLYDQTFRDGLSDWPSMESPFSEFEKLSPNQIFTSKNVTFENESPSKTISVRVVDHLSTVGTDRKAGKEMESQMISEKETDTLSAEHCSTSSARDRAVIPSAIVEVKLATQSTNDTVVVNQNEETETSNNSNFKYNTHEQANRTVSDIARRPNYSESHQSYAEQHSHRVPEYRYRDNPRDENVRIRIKRPTDYIRQWEDTVDRLSAVSVTDEFGSPRSPLISSYKVSLPRRSKSLDAGASSYKNPNSHTSTSFGKDYALVFRSKSSDAHTHILSTDHLLRHGDNTSTTSVERGHSDVRAPSNRLDRLTENIHRRTEDAASLPMYTRGSETPTTKEDITLTRENLYVAAPQGNIISHRTHPQGFSEVDQTILKKRDRFEPPSSGSRVRFQQQTNVISHHEQRSLSEGTDSATLNDNIPNISQRVHSLSPHRRMISSHLLSDGSESGALYSATQRSRLMSLQQPILTREPEVDTKYTHLATSSDLSTPATHIQGNGLLLDDFSLHSRIFEDESSSMMNAANLSPGTRGNENSEENYSISSRDAPSVRLSMNTPFKDASSLDFEWDFDRSYVGNLGGSRDPSPPPIRKGGAGRVPRREAWEQERRRKEDESILGNQTDAAAQARVIELLYNEIEVLKQKVEMLEEGGASRGLSLLGRSTSGVHTTRNRPFYIVENNQIFDGERMTTSISGSHQRATSCPLLQLSSRSKATRSFPRGSAAAETSRTPVNPQTSTYPGWSSKPNSAACSLHTSSGQKRVYDSQKHVFSMFGTLEPNELEKMKELVSRRELSESEVCELKQAVVCALAENDILLARLNNARDEIHDKLKHTNRVLDDCRHHLAKAQTENMELRTVLEQEKQKTQSYACRIRELEKGILEVRTDNQQLENELDQTATLLDHSLNKTKPGVDALKVDNSRLISRLAVVEHENYSLREEVRIFKQNQTKAMKTMDDLRECLSKIRQERQELFDKLTSLQRQEQNGRVREIINSYQETAALDKWEKEQDLMDEAKRVYFDCPRSNSSVSPDCPYCALSFRHSTSLDDTDRMPQKLSKHSDCDSLQANSRQFSRQQQLFRHKESPLQDREIYPHRRGYTRSRSHSPHNEGRSASSPGYYSALSMDKSFLDHDIPERAQDIRREGQIFVSSGVQCPQPIWRFSCSPSRHRTTVNKACNPSSSLARSPQRSMTYSKPYPHQCRLARSFSSAEDLSSRHFPHTPHVSILKAVDGGRDKHYTAWRRSPSPSYRSYGDIDFHGRGYSGNNRLSSSLERDPVYFTHRNHSPPTRLSAVDNERAIPVAKNKRRPLHTKIGSGETARRFQNQFDRDDKMVSSLSKSQSKSWFECQSDSDGEDTGINSSMSSRSSCENMYARKRTPLLSDEQRRYADQLIQKYTGNIPYKQTV